MDLDKALKAQNRPKRRTRTADKAFKRHSAPPRRTTILFDEDVLAALKSLSSLEQIPMSTFVNDVVKTRLKTRGYYPPRKTDTTS